MKQIWRYSFLIGLFVLSISASAQTDSMHQEKPNISIFGLIDVFYGFDLSQNQSDYRLPFLYNYNRHNEFNLNFGLIKASVTHSKYRANIALHSGTYVIDNYASETAPLNNVFEANAGVALNKSGKTWIDAGIMPSHIGFESAISHDNWTLTRSLLAENSPYFMAGAKLSHQFNSRVQAAILALNGWQRIKMVDGNSLISLGTQLTYKPGDSLLLNWSMFAGTDDPDTSRRMRYFNNFYGQIWFNRSLALTLGFDAGLQQKIKESTDYDLWFSPVLIARLSLSEYWTAVARVEYYQDKSSVIIDVPGSEGFSTTGFSFGLDYSPYKEVLCRFEARNLHDKNQIYAYNDGSRRRDNVFFVTSIAVKFGAVIAD